MILELVWKGLWNENFLVSTSWRSSLILAVITRFIASTKLMLCHLIPVNENLLSLHIWWIKNQVYVSWLITCNYLKCFSLLVHLFLFVLHYTRASIQPSLHLWRIFPGTTEEFWWKLLLLWNWCKICLNGPKWSFLFQDLFSKFFKFVDRGPWVVVRVQPKVV